MTLRTAWLHVSGYSYALDLHNTDVATVIASIKEAVEEGHFIDVSVLDEKDRVLTLHLNGKLVDVFVTDNGRGARPHEISHKPPQP